MRQFLTKGATAPILSSINTKFMFISEEVFYIKLSLPIRSREDVPATLMLDRGDYLEMIIDIKTGQILDFPKVLPAFDLFLKVVDGGFYKLLDSARQVLSEIDQDYVPHGVVPGEYGDYVDLQINADGIITNWPKQFDYSEFPNYQSN